MIISSNLTLNIQICIVKLNTIDNVLCRRMKAQDVVEPQSTIMPNTDNPFAGMPSKPPRYHNLFSLIPRGCQESKNEQ